MTFVGASLFSGCGQHMADFYIQGVPDICDLFLIWFPWPCAAGAAPMYFPGAYMTDGSAYPAPHPVPCYSGHTLVGYAWYGQPPAQYGGAPWTGLAVSPTGSCRWGARPTSWDTCRRCTQAPGHGWWPRTRAGSPYWATHGHTMVRAE